MRFKYLRVLLRAEVEKKRETFRKFYRREGNNGGFMESKEGKTGCFQKQREQYGK